MGNPIPIDVELIAVIKGLPFVGMDPTPLLKKDQEATIAASMKEKYGIVKDNI